MINESRDRGALQYVGGNRAAPELLAILAEVPLKLFMDT
jgi:hypothetical protein